mmetsp:Transcript_62860/g.153058  ORF Transcript_62860/g.153058 Transcript_62860/m.153058 type:complete len:112 (-) Transcript_62860:308-643(-)
MIGPESSPRPTYRFAVNGYATTGGRTCGRTLEEYLSSSNPVNVENDDEDEYADDGCGDIGGGCSPNDGCCDKSDGDVDDDVVVPVDGSARVPTAAMKCRVHDDKFLVVLCR